MICPFPNPAGSLSSSSSREALLRQRVENLLETLDKVTKNNSERQKHSDDLMEDLKRAVSSSIGKRLSAENIMEMVKLGEKFSAQKLKELCTDFLISNQAHGNVARKILGFNLEQTFKKRMHFKSDEEYRVYFMNTVKPNMIVQHSKANKKEVVGRVVSCNASSIVVRWQNGNSNTFYSKDFHILTPPINMKMFTNYPETECIY